jgi:hypothetical protein
LRICENSLLRRIAAPEREEVTGEYLDLGERK